MSAKRPRKGDSLERAVNLIQLSILQSDPRLKGAKFTVERNVILTIAGVRHEIDILVKTLPGSDYESTCIFECKDWRKPVGKNEVMILARKVELAGANRGFLVARQLSRDAKAQLKLDSRLRFLPCNDDFLSPFKTLEILHVQHDPLPIKVLVKERGVPAKENPDPLPWRDALCSSHGEPVDFTAIVSGHVSAIVEEDKKANFAKYQFEGNHFGHEARLVKFDPGELTINRADIEHLAIEVEFWVHIAKPKLVSKFELSGHGQVYSFEPINPIRSKEALQIDIVYRA